MKSLEAQSQRGLCFPPPMIRNLSLNVSILGRQIWQTFSEVFKKSRNFLWKNQNIRKNLPNPVFKKSDIFLYFGVIWSCESEFYVRGQFPLVGRWHFGQFCTIGPGGIGVGLEWDGSQRCHPKPRPSTPGIFFGPSLFLYQKKIQ